MQLYQRRHLSTLPMTAVLILIYECFVGTKVIFILQPNIPDFNRLWIA